jgi:acetyl-CoA carboxylase/biotin carboxylase 1
LTSFAAKLPKSAAGQPTHEVFIVCQGCDKDIGVKSVEADIKAEERMLQKLGISKVNVVVPVAKQNPAYFTFPQYNEFKEDVSRRGMRPTAHHILELERLDANYGKSLI